MATLFALGLMSIGWMVLIAALIAAEKLLPWGVLARSAVTGALVPSASPSSSSPGSYRDARVS